MGAKKRPYYRIVAADSRRSRDGRFLETLGTYNPIATPAEVKVAEDKLVYWLEQGATPSETVKSLLTQIGFTEKLHRRRRGEDVSEVPLKTTLRQGKKRTRKVKKAAVAAETPAQASTETPPAAPEQAETKE